LTFTQMIENIINQILNLFWWLDYSAIIFLMTLESSIFPVPSELVMIPAGYFVAIWKLNFLWVIMVWTIWTLNYFILWQLIGKPFLLKYGKYFLIKEKDYHKAETLFLKNDKLYTFLWRLIPVIRHLISIPAWIFKMNYLIFLLITALWSCLWCIVLTTFWYYFGEWIVKIVLEYTDIIKYIVVILIIVWVVWFIYWKIKNNPAKGGTKV
jgi:membrane protein DedA with SNARE-associated domain